MPRFVWTFVLALALGGCATFGSNLEVEDLAGKTAVVPSMLVDADLPQTRVLIIHGIGGNRCPGYSAYRNRYSDKKIAAGAMTEIADQLGLCLLDDPVAGQAGAQQCDEERPHTFPPEITLTKFDYAEKTTGQACSGASVLRSYEIYYTGALEKAEQSVIKRDEEVFENQVYLNKLLKDDIVVSGLGDAVAYLGYFGPVIRSAVRGTICDMVSDPNQRITTNAQKSDALISCSNIREDEAREARSVYVVSHSLGSNIVFDTLYPDDAKDESTIEASAIDVFVSNFKAAYLLANQDALINLVRAPNAVEDGFGSMQMQSELLQPKRGPRGEPYKPMIVGFSDRNDVLSYALGTAVCGDREDQCLNAVLNVAKFGLPWLFVNPATAHTGYWYDKTILECIAKGC